MTRGWPDEFVRQYYTAFNERRIADACALFTRDATVEHLSFGAAHHGSDAFAQFAAKWLRAFPDALFTVERVEQCGDTICEVDLVATGTHLDVLDLAAYGTFKPSGARTTIHMRELLEVRGGKITHASLSFDIHDLVHQLASIDYAALMRHLDQLQQLRDELATVATDRDAQRNVTERIGRELDAARLVVRPWFRR